MLLLEKAWAKIYGSYQRIEAGLTGEALPFLTGAPSGTYMHERYYWNPDKLWELIENADEKGFVMTTAVASESNSTAKWNANDARSAGLVDAHAYSLIAALEIDIGLLQKQKLLMIRNPWGFKEWNGQWGDSSNKWKQHPSAKQSIIDILSKRQNTSADNIRETYLKQDSNDGCFWISFDDYTRFFCVTSICYTSPKFTNNWIEDMQEGKFGVISLKVHKDIDTDCLLTLNQINHRHMDETMRGCYKYAAVKLVVAQVVDQKKNIGKKDIVYVSGESSDETSRDGATPLRFGSLPKGEYLVLYSVEWTRLHPERKIIVSLYSAAAADEITLRRLDESQFTDDLFDLMAMPLDESANSRKAISEHRKQSAYQSELF